MSPKNVFAAAAVLVAVACVPPTVTQQGSPAPMPLTYSFTPPSSAPPRSANVTLALVEPSWAEQQMNENLLSFGSSMKNDFTALLTARGFSVRGPFSSWQSMVYPDKTGSDLVLEPKLQIVPRIDPSDLSTHNATSLSLSSLMSKGTDYTVNGAMTILGKVSLEMHESMTNELMWKKDIEIQPIRVAWVGEKVFNTVANGQITQQTASLFYLKDPGYQRAVWPKLQEMYRMVLQASWDYLDPREIQMVKTQATALKKK